MAESEAVTRARRALGEQLAAARAVAGHCQHGLAPLTGYSRSTLANVETGRQHVQRDFWERCDATLGTAGTLAASFDRLEDLIRAQKDGEARRSRAEREDRVRRHRATPQTQVPTGRQGGGQGGGRESAGGGTAAERLGAAPAGVPELVAVLRLPGQAHAGDVGGRPVTAGDLDAVRECTRALRRLDNGFGGGHAHALAVQYLESTVMPLLRGGEYTENLGRELLGAAAQLAHLVAWTAYDIGDHLRARWYFAKALELATGAGDHAFAGEILAARGHHAVHLGDAREAVELARASRQAAREAAIPALLAEAHALEANGHALLGDAKACTASLAASERAFHRCETAGAQEWLAYASEGYLAARFAHCLRDLGDWAQARSYAQQAAAMSGGLTRARAFNTAVLATTYAEDDPGQACSVGLEALGLAAELRSARLARYAVDLRRRIEASHGDDAALRRFSGRVTEVLGGTEWR